MAEKSGLIKKQNRTLFFIFGLLTVLLTIILSRQGLLKDSTLTNAIEVKDGAEGNLPEPAQEAMGEPIKEATLDLSKLDDQKMFQIIMGDLMTCFELKGAVSQDLSAVTIEALLTLVQSDLGPPMKLTDKWMNWHLRNTQGVEHRLRLELNEDADGRVFRVLRSFGVDKEGLPVPDPAESPLDPSDEAINLKLKEGEVFYKEKASQAAFAGSEKIDYIEKNGTLAELEMQSGERFFRCQNLKSRDACQCIH